MTSNVVQYAHGSDFELNLLKDGTIRINLSPNNKYGILDIPDFLPRRVIQIAATGMHALVLLEDETVYGWGADHYGQCPNYNFQKDVEYKYYNNIGLKDQYLKYYSFIFYYNISPNIEGGEIEFENGEKYKPSEFEVLCFDNESKYKINKVLNKGTISTLIMNLEKK
jgi:alpha-tubulin suppressor-like RCC1 family protein